jgi:hypothetical protein
VDNQRLDQWIGFAEPRTATIGPEGGERSGC